MVTMSRYMYAQRTYFLFNLGFFTDTYTLNTHFLFHLSFFIDTLNGIGLINKV